MLFTGTAMDTTVIMEISRANGIFSEQPLELQLFLQN